MELRERVLNLLERNPVDRASFHEALWPETVERWKKEGRFKSPEQSPSDLLAMEIEGSWPFNCIANLDFEKTVIEDNAETCLARDGNGALLRTWKNKSGTPEHVDFLVKDRAGWETHIKPFLKPERRRINFAAYREAKKQAAEKNKFFVWQGVNVFEQMHPVCGHEYLLMGMALDPDWVREMAQTYSDRGLELAAYKK